MYCYESNKKLNKKIMNTMEKADWKIHKIYEQDGEYFVEIENYSPAGENIVEAVWFDGTSKGFVDGLRKCADDFDADEHAELWVNHRGENGVPETIRELLDDAEAIKQMLVDISNNVETIMNK